MNLSLNPIIDKKSVFNTLQCSMNSSFYSYYEKVYLEVSEEAKKIIKLSFYLKETKEIFLHSFLNKNATILAGLITLGSDIDKKIKEYFSQDNYLEAMMLNTIGDIILFNASKDVDKLVKDRYSNSKNIRLSPGDYGFPYENQKIILDILGDLFKEVSMTDSYMLKPEKSLSFIYGLAPLHLKDLIKPNCVICKGKECLYKDVCKNR